MTVDDGSITWFAVSGGGQAGFSSVLRQSDRFALLYVDAADITPDQLATLLRAASAELR